MLTMHAHVLYWYHSYTKNLGGISLVNTTCKVFYCKLLVIEAQMSDKT